MATPAANSDQIIELVSSDAEPSPTKKRSLESDPNSTFPHTASTFGRGFKRKRVKSPSKSDAGSPGSQKADDGEVDGVQSGVEMNGESSSDESQGGVTINEETTMAAATSKSATTSGWNPSINKVVMRTSLSQPITDKSEPSSLSLPTFQKNRLTFQLPLLPDKMEGTWFARYKQWATDFCQCNPENAHAITSTMALAAYDHYLDNYTTLKPKKKRGAKQAARELHKSGTVAGIINDIRASTSAQPAGPSNAESKLDASHTSGEMPHAAWLKKHAGIWNGVREEQLVSKKGSPSWGDIPTGDLALEQQRRYFPSASDPSAMCLLCGRDTHIAANCPDLRCRFCDGNNHSDVRCPRRIRCAICRQLGHEQETCIEKLALTKDEGLACGFCDSEDHLENLCTDVWRSFHPDETTIRKVSFIPASCSLCGENDHFSADCEHRQGIFSNPTWSLKNRDRYIDWDCDAVQVDKVPVGTKSTATTGGPELRIRGHAARTVNVHYSESDSDGEVRDDFLSKRPLGPKQRGAQLGQIRVSSNIQMPQDANSRGTNGHTNGNSLRGQPPLPPGPPPAGPPPAGLPSRQSSFGQPPPAGPAYGSRPSGQPTSLPPKPPAPTYRGVPPPPELQETNGQSWQSRDSGNASRGGKSRGAYRGGRGGRGGRGRGRGRGNRRD